MFWVMRIRFIKSLTRRAAEIMPLPTTGMAENIRFSTILKVKYASLVRITEK